MNNGYIAIHRKILDNPVCYKDPDYFTVWVTILLLAQHSKRKADFMGKSITLKPGQFITGRKFLARKTKVNESKIERIAKRLENEQQIEQQKTNKNRLITIINWNKYQKREQQNEQQVNNNRTTSEQQVNTYNNDNKEDKENNIYRGDKPPDITSKMKFKEFIKKFNSYTKRNFKPTEQVYSKYKARIKEGYTIKEFSIAFSNAMKDDFLTGDNPGGKWYLTPEYILRTDKLEKWLNVQEINLSKGKDV